MSKSIFSVLLICCWPFLLSAQESGKDTLAKVDTVHTTDTHSDAHAIKPHQLRFGFDVGKLLVNRLYDNRVSYEGFVDYYLKNELYLTADIGAGNSDIDYPDLKYTTRNVFVRAGIDKALFERKKPQDWGMGFVGLRYGLGFVQRNDAGYTTNDGLGGITSGTIPADHFTAHWLELTGGMRLEIWKRFFAGWNIRIKFLLNQKSFGDLKPAAIAGYGPAEKANAFDYNFYIAYAIRWSSSR